MDISIAGAITQLTLKDTVLAAKAGRHWSKRIPTENIAARANTFEATHFFMVHGTFPGNPTAIPCFQALGSRFCVSPFRDDLPLITVFQ